MSKKKTRKPGKPHPPESPSRHRRQTVVIIGLILCLGLTGVLMAKWKAARVVGMANAMLVSPAPLPTPTFSPSNPSKEYIYAGGKLVAIEEPTATTTPTPSPTPPLGENVVWQRPSGVSVSSNILTKNGGVAGWNAGASSTRALAGDGYVEFTATETNTDRMLGLNNSDLDYGYTEIDYGLYLTGYGGLAVYQSGSSSGLIGSYVAGDRLRISVSSGVIHFLKNGSEFYSLSSTPAFPLVVDTTLATNGSTITNVVLSGTLANAPVTENVAWTNAVGVSVSGNSLTKTGTVSGWNAGASSTRALAGNGYVEFTATETNTDRMFGLNDADSGQGYAEINYGIYLTNYGGYAVYHSGSSSGLLGYYAAGDVFRISIDNNVVTFRKNGVTFHTSAVTPTYPLVVDTTLATTGSTITNVIISGNLAP
jgi:hypothetical protein